MYIIALDEGTTSVRAILYDGTGKAIVSSSKPIKIKTPRPGWVQQDAEEIYGKAVDVLKELINKAGVAARDIAAIGIANQRETVVVWDRKTGMPVYDAIVWQCRRTADICEKIKAEGMAEEIFNKTGLEVDAYFSATKIKWILENVPGALYKALNGQLIAGTIDSYLIWKLTEEHKHVTDPTNASRTMLFNIKELKWDKDLIRYFDIPIDMLPEVVDSSSKVGYTSVLGDPVLIGGIIGDQQASLFGQCCFDIGEAKNTYGTGSFMLINTGDYIKAPSGLLNTVGWTIRGKATYAIEGSIFISGALIQWLRDQMGILKTAQESEELALQVSDNGGIYIVPAFTGLGAPYWDMYARGLIIGITRGTTKAHIARAALEAMAYQVYDIFDMVENNSGFAIKSLKVDGGASSNNFLMQFQANILGVDVIRPEDLETTARGAAYMSGLTAGVWDMEILKKLNKEDRVFKPDIDFDRARAIKGWRRAVERSKSWAI
ncbi:glycerol kinase [Caldanaerobius fijiensis DSM 17918]|uniref:glycerol kinase n=1 Tax=Caldanaerobius fijiensis DSM 17918 TaxID=1121256 RepID=A0A1M5A9W7_9THEO|nr:glycerol kinase GlpK [Caldanaerobius fijiensis]SHF26877.1 glycerol kinase [Caldanaerobius fijiensis DSM 17918]